MLKLFRRKNIAKLVLWGLLILILPAFVLWGTGSLGRSDKGPKYFGLINNNKISFDEFGEGLIGIRCQIKTNYFNQQKMLDLFLKDNQFLAKLAWDRLIVLKEAKRQKIKVSDKEVVDYIRSHPLFLQKGVFDDKIYNMILSRYIGLDPRTFEEIVRENLKIKKLNDIIAKDVKVPDEEILENYRKESDKFKISYYLVPTNNFLDKTNISDADAKNYYEKNQREFILPSKEGEDQKTEIVANFEDVKVSIKQFLSESKARPLAHSSAEDEYKKIKTIVDKENKTFEEACGKLNLKLKETVFFSKTDSVDGIGEAEQIAGTAVKLKKDEVSVPLDVRKGSIIFKVTGTQTFDEERFKKEKEEYSKKLGEKKQGLVLEEWLKKEEANTKINIDLKELDKYYR